MIAALSEAIGHEHRRCPVAPPAAAKPRRFRPWMLAPGGCRGGGAAARLSSRVGVAGADGPAARRWRRRRRTTGRPTIYWRTTIGHRTLETAIALLETIVARDPHFAPAFADLGRANLLQFIPQRDTKYIEPAREIVAAGGGAGARPGLASRDARQRSTRARRRTTSRATNWTRRCGSTSSTRRRTARWRICTTRQGRTDLVEPNFQKAVSLAPDDWSLVQQLGEHYLNGGKWAEAGEQYRHAAELTPDNPRAHNNLGLAYRGLDRLEESAAAFQKAIDLEPTFLRVRNLGMVLAEAGKYPEAARMLERSIDMRPTQYRAWGLLAGVYLNQHADATRSGTLISKPSRCRRTCGNGHRGIPISWPMSAATTPPSGWKRRALPLLAQAAALAPDAPEVLYQVAVGYETLHRRDEALRLIAKARAGGYASGAIARNPQLAALRADPRYTDEPSAIVGSDSARRRIRVYSVNARVFEIAFPQPGLDALICAATIPNVDRSSAPPAPRTKKAAKKKPRRRSRRKNASAYAGVLSVEVAAGHRLGMRRRRRGRGRRARSGERRA